MLNDKQYGKNHSLTEDSMGFRQGVIFLLFTTERLFDVVQYLV